MLTLHDPIVFSRYRIRVIACVVFLLTVSSDAEGDELENALAKAVLPIDQPIVTQRDYAAVNLAYVRRAVFDAYTASDERDPRWDQDMLLLAHTVTTSISMVGTDPPDYPLGIRLMSRNDVRDLVDRLVKKGAQGPIIDYCLAWGYTRSKRSTASEKIILRAGPQIMGTEAHPALQVWVGNRWLKALDADNDAEIITEVETQIDAAALNAISGPFVHPGERRIVYDTIWSTYDGSEFVRRNAFILAAEASPTADPWLVAVLRGEHEIETAWEKRGTKWGHEVAPEGWVGFREHLQQARTALIRAGELEPGYPESFTCLIAVAMGGVAEGVENERYWFERAQAEQFDWHPEYRRMLWALRPRWGGSHEKMLAFGREALASERFDTGVPKVLIEAVEAVIADQDDEDYQRLWRDPAVQADLETYFAGVKRSPNRATVRNKDLSLEAVLAYRGHRFQHALDLIKQLGDRFYYSQWSHVGVEIHSVAMREMRARVGPAGPWIDKAEAFAEEGNLGAALITMEAAQMTLPEGHRDRGHCWRRIVAFIAHPDQPEQHDISLTSREALRGQIHFTGNWRILEDGRLQGQSPGHPGYGGRFRHTGTVFGTRFRVRGHAELPPVINETSQPNAAVIFGLHFHDRRAWYHPVTFVRNPQTPRAGRVVFAQRFDRYTDKFLAEVPEEFDFSVTLNGNLATVSINGVVIVANHPVNRYRPNHASPGSIGVGYRAFEPDQSVYFRDVWVTPRID